MGIGEYLYYLRFFLICIFKPNFYGFVVTSLSATDVSFKVKTKKNTFTERFLGSYWANFHDFFYGGYFQGHKYGCKISVAGVSAF